MGKAKQAPKLQRNGATVKASKAASAKAIGKQASEQPVGEPDDLTGKRAKARSQSQTATASYKVAALFTSECCLLR
jgi:hypothetical protein